jgi:large subunit ribosomal protein L6
MSRLGKLPVAIPEKVKVDINGQHITIKGAKGELVTVVHEGAKISFSEGKVFVEPANDSKLARSMWGTARANINNMVKGVTEGFTIRMEIFGVGFKAALEKDILNISLGYSHDIKYVVPTGIEIKLEKPTLAVISGADKQLVGQVAAELHRLRRYDPYKGKGILYEGKKMRRKEGKKK